MGWGISYFLAFQCVKQEAIVYTLFGFLTEGKPLFVHLSKPGFTVERRLLLLNWWLCYIVNCWFYARECGNIL